jgi:uncharacterized protein YjbI with pentapeptide repeats
MTFHHSFYSLLLATTLSTTPIALTPVLAQNASDIPKVADGGKCGIKWDASDKCDVTGANYSGQKITGFYLSLEAAGTNFTDAYISTGTFDDANFTKANFTDARIAANSFHRANLTGAQLIRTTITNTSLESVNLTNADMTGAIIPEWEGTFKQWATLCNTTLPDGSISNRDC